MSFLSGKQARFTQLAILTLCLLTGIACSQTNKETTQMTYSNPYNLQFSGKEAPYVKDKNNLIRFNPNPKKVYEITWEIKDSPVQLIPVGYPTDDDVMGRKMIVKVGYTGYTKSNKQYRYDNLLYSLGVGADIDYPIIKIDDNTFKTYYVDDALLNEDYGVDDLGMCYWKSDGIYLRLNKEGKYISPVVTTELGLAIDDEYKDTYLKDGVNTVFYYKKQDLTKQYEQKYYEYEGKLLPSLPETIDASPNNLADLKRINPSLKEEDIFTITMKVRSMN